MNELLTYENLITGGTVVGTLRFLFWKYWQKPRQEARIREIVREELGPEPPLPHGWWGG